MSEALNLTSWLGLVLMLALGSAVAVALAALLSCLSRAAVWQRTIWRANMVCLAVLVLGEVTGTGNGVSAWFAVRMSSARQAQVPELGTVGAGDSRLGTRGPANTNSPPLAAECRVAGSEPAVLSSEPQVSIRWWPGVVWLLGTSVIGGRILVGRLLLLVFRWRFRSSSDEALASQVERVAQQLGIRRRVSVLMAPGLRGPAAFGILRPTIALPLRFSEELDAVKQEAMLAHELAHLAARDPAWLLVADLVTAALWWHPLIWWARRQLHAASESAADEASLVVADGPHVLASCLLELGTQLIRSRQGGWVRMAGANFRSSLGRRVQRLVQLRGQSWRPPSRAWSGLMLILGPVALVAAALLATAWARPQAFPEGDLPMNVMQHCWQRSLAGALLFAAMGTSGDTMLAADPQDKGNGEVTRDQQGEKQNAGAEETTPKGGADQIAKQDKDTALRTKVFRLKHCDPQELRQIVNDLLTVSTWGSQPFETVTNVTNVTRPQAVFITNNAPVQGPRTAIDNRTRSLIVRATAQELRTVSDLIAMLDLAPGKAMPKVKNLRVFKLRYVKSRDVVMILSDLQFNARIAPIQKPNAVIVSGPEDLTKEISDVIEALDIEDGSAPTEKPEEKQ